jgi:ABC-type glycerol-3-phosphate transport system permease component
MSAPKRYSPYVLLAVCSAVLLLPFAYLICASLKPNEDFFTSMFLPTGDGLFGIAWDRLTLSHFGRLFRKLDFGNHVLNSFFMASVTSVLATLFCAMGGYALAKFQFRGRAALTAVVLSAVIVPAALLLAPTYQLLYWFGLLDTFAGVILPAAVPAFGVYLFRQAIISGLPDEIIEAARIDGCGEIRIFFTMALPLVRPMIGAFLLVTYLGTWNNFIWPQVVLQSADKLPLSVAIAQLKSVYSQDYGLLMAGTLVSVAPVLILFILLQREFIAGLTSGAVKG